MVILKVQNAFYVAGILGAGNSVVLIEKDIIPGVPDGEPESPEFIDEDCVEVGWVRSIRA